MRGWSLWFRHVRTHSFGLDQLRYRITLDFLSFVCLGVGDQCLDDTVLGLELGRFNGSNAVRLFLWQHAVHSAVKREHIEIIRYHASLLRVIIHAAEHNQELVQNNA